MVENVVNMSEDKTPSTTWRLISQCIRKSESSYSPENSKAGDSLFSIEKILIA